MVKNTQNDYDASSNDFTQFRIGLILQQQESKTRRDGEGLRTALTAQIPVHLEMKRHSTPRTFLYNPSQNFFRTRRVLYSLPPQALRRERSFAPK